tara:strand:+ start:127 stop:939 length:813 start_codon:yes stop_codon:yes gene_type:complete
MRIKLKEISFNRVYSALLRRLKNIPELYHWNSTKVGKDNQREISKYKDIHKGERCFLIANGPSIAKMDLSILKNEFTFGMNRIYMIYDKLQFVPTYHFVTNELVLQQFADDLKEVESIKFYNWTERRLFKAKKSLNFMRLKYSLTDLFSKNPEEGIYSGGTVTYATLQFIYYMGFSEVYILGLDHSFKEKGQPNKTEVRHQEKDESHFHPNYFPKGSKWQLPDLLRSEIAYKKAREAFEGDGRKIIDATDNGHCTVFEKKSFHSVVESIN